MPGFSPVLAASRAVRGLRGLWLAIGCATLGCDSAAIAPSEQVAAGKLAAAFQRVVAPVRNGVSREIDFPAAGLGDDDLAPLAELKNLEVLRLGPTTVTDAGLAHLRGLKELRQLNLATTEATDAGLASLADLTNLELLRLGSSRITGSGLIHLKRLDKLRHLIVQNAPLSDEGLASLPDLPALESLYLEGTAVSERSLSELQRRLANRVHIHPHP